MKQDKAIFMSQAFQKSSFRGWEAFPYKNNEILVLILPFKSAFYLILIPYYKKKPISY
jgi:hypothetical protein